MTTKMTPYAKLLRFKRTELGLSQVDVAKRLHLSRASYLALERGDRELTLKEALGVTALYAITIDELMSNNRPDVDTYEMMIRLFIKIAGTEKVTLKKTKLCQLLYLADMRSFYETKKSISGMTYRKFTFGPANDTYFRLIDEMEARGDITITQVVRDDYHMYEIRESRGGARQKITRLTPKETNIIEQVAHAWLQTPTAELFNFIESQKPYRNSLAGGEIAYVDIIDEAPHLVS